MTRAGEPLSIGVLFMLTQNAPGSSRRAEPKIWWVTSFCLILVVVIVIVIVIHFYKL